MNTSSDKRNPVELLAVEFLDRKRRGEHPTLGEYLERHPELAGEIRDLFPALLMMEDLGQSSGLTTGSLAADNGAVLGIRLQRLGDYRILREIGRGGMGVVYEAEQESLGRRVALKVLSAGALLDPKQVRRFEREAKAAARLHHTNIVPVFGVGRQDGHHYFVMQFIAGLGLDVVLDDLRRLRRAKSEAGSAAGPAAAASRIAGLSAADVARSLITGRFDADRSPGDGSLTEPFDDSALAAANGNADGSGSSPAILPGSSELSASSDPDRQFYRSVARIGIQVAEALEYANRQGILHRDVKPSNLLLDNHGNVWVADFGLAKTAEADDLTHTGDILGTIRYMAPERFSGHCDARSDVYSLGLTLYELVSLRPAYEASDRHTLMDRVLREEPERLKKLAPGVPRDLETIVAKATARDPAGRYVTAGALAEDLGRFVEDRPIRARRISPAERLARWCRRNKGLASSVGVTAAALVAAAVLSLLYADRQRRHAAEQAAANKRITRLAADLERESGALKEERATLKNERGRLKNALAESNSRLARLDLERGQAAFEKGEDGAGMLWTVESLRMAAAAGDEAGRHVALANLSAWRRHVVELKQVFCRGDAVTSVVFSPDGKMILTGSLDKTARLWDAATGRPVGQAMEHSSQVMSVAFSPDCKTIVTGMYHGNARLWDAATSRSIGQPLPHSGGVGDAAFSPDGKTIVTGDVSSNARLWDAATGRPLGPPIPHQRGVIAVSFSPDGKAILTGGFDKTARLWDAATGQPVGPPLQHSDRVDSVTFSPDGKTILTGSWDKTARLWDAATGRQLGRPMDHADRVYSVAFSPDGKTVLTGCAYDMAQLWDAATGQRVGRPMEHQGDVRAVAFSPDGRSILTGSQDGTAQLWEAPVDQPVGRPLDYASQSLAVALSPDGQTLLVGSFDGKVRRWDVALGHPLGQPVTLESSIEDVAFSPDGKTILTGSSGDKTARLWDAATGRPFGQPMKHSKTVSLLAFSPDGETILTASGDLTALWDAATGRPLGPPVPHPGGVNAAAFSPDGKTIVVSTGGDHTARLWDAATGRQLGQPMPHSGPVLSVSFSPDGKTILTAGRRTVQVALWDAATGRPLGPALAHSSDVYRAAFSPDGKMIVTAGNDNGARLWDTATGQPIGPPLPHSTARFNALPRVAFSLDGRFLLTSDSSTARLWDAPAPLPGDLARLAAWVQTQTGMEIDKRGSMHVLDHSTWLDRRLRLEQLGGPPPADRTLRLDPILYGADPAARGDALTERGLWAQAEAAYADAIRARPLNSSVRQALARMQIGHSRIDRAVTTLKEAVQQMPEDLGLRLQLSMALLWSGDRAAWRRSNAALLDRFRGTTDAMTARTVAWACVLGPDAAADPDVPVRPAEAGVRGATGTAKYYSLSTLGAALYRAGRFDDAIRRLEEGNRLGGGVIPPQDWAFFAMAHYHLGHHDLALRWLERLRNHRPSESPDLLFWDLRIPLLLSEAVVLYDPVFPADMFAH